MSYLKVNTVYNLILKRNTNKYLKFFLIVKAVNKSVDDGSKTY